MKWRGAELFVGGPPLAAARRREDLHQRQRGRRLVAANQQERIQRRFDNNPVLRADRMNQHGHAAIIVLEYLPVAVPMHLHRGVVIHRAAVVHQVLLEEPALFPLAVRPHPRDAVARPTSERLAVPDDHASHVVRLHSDLITVLKGHGISVLPATLQPTTHNRIRSSKEVGRTAQPRENQNQGNCAGLLIQLLAS